MKLGNPHRFSEGWYRKNRQEPKDETVPLGPPLGADETPQPGVLYVDADGTMLMGVTDPDEQVKGLVILTTGRLCLPEDCPAPIHRCGDEEQILIGQQKER